MILWFRHFVKMALAGTLIPAFVFAQNETELDLQMMQNEARFRYQVEAESFALTQKLCDVFVLRKKFQMGLYPDPATETYITLDKMNHDERARYYSSLVEWLKIGNKGIIANWGFDDGPVMADETLLIMSNSRFTKTLVVTKGFHEASIHCGALNAISLKSKLYEQEITQAAFSFVTLPAIAFRLGAIAWRSSWPLVAPTFLGRAAAKVPWSGVKKSAFGALVALVAYAGYHDYQLHKEKKNPPKQLNAPKDNLQENIHEALNYWYQNKTKKSERFKKVEAFLLENKEALRKLQREYETELQSVGEEQINKIVAQYIAAKGKLDSDEETQIFIKAAAFSTIDIFLKNHP